jgi:RluA family pseudouridine synthase
MKKKDFEVVFSNSDFIAVDKASGIAVIPERWEDGSDLKTVLEHFLKEELYAVHRIDKETSGLVLFAKNPEMHRYLNQLFENREIEKEYLAIVDGVFGYKEFTADYPIFEPKSGRCRIDQETGKPSETVFLLEESFRDFALIKAFPKTGRKHQIRVHLSFMGTPILGDPVYSRKKALFLSEMKKNYHLKKGKEERPLIQRTALHAHVLSFVLPGGEPIKLEAPLPKDMKATINQLRKYNKSPKEFLFG